jgi:hypothetical protein
MNVRIVGAALGTLRRVFVGLYIPGRSAGGRIDGVAESRRGP